RLFALYVAGYSFGRFFVELMRNDEATHVLGIRINSFTSALVFLGAMAYFALATKGRETPEQLQPGAEPRPWPWQIAALRAAGASGGDTATTPVDVTKKTDAPGAPDDEETETAETDADATEATAKKS